MTAIRVSIVDDLKMICEGFKNMICHESEFEVVGFAHNGKEAIALIEETKPDVVLIDLLMPVMDGIEATKEISYRFPLVKIIIISSFKSQNIISQAISVGASGYLSKNVKVEEAIQAIQSVYLGQSYFSPGLPSSSIVFHALNRQNNTNNTFVTSNIRDRVEDISLQAQKDDDVGTTIDVSCKVELDRAKANNMYTYNTKLGLAIAFSILILFQINNIENIKHYLAIWREPLHQRVQQ